MNDDFQKQVLIIGIYQSERIKWRFYYLKLKFCHIMLTPTQTFVYIAPLFKHIKFKIEQPEICDSRSIGDGYEWG